MSWLILTLEVMEPCSKAFFGLIFDFYLRNVCVYISFIVYYISSQSLWSGCHVQIK